VRGNGDGVSIYNGYVPQGLRTTQGFSGQIPMQFEGLNGPPFEGTSFFVSVRDFEHATLCRAFRLDPNRFYFDVPSTMRGVGSSSGAHSHVRRDQHGFVFMSGRNDPVARIRIVHESDRFNDTDPLSDKDMQDLAKWTRR
jgi:hypothetical protein